MISRLGCLQQLSEINDHLYLSGAAPIRPDRIRQRKISCIINVTVDEPSLYLPGIDYLKIRVDDSPFAHLDSYFDLVADRIKATKDRGGKTLLHCVAGVSRSASLALVYLMKFERMSLRQAYYHVKSCRPIIRPNPGFWRQLIDYERRLQGRNTVKMVLSKFNDMVPDVYTEEVKSTWVPTILKPPASQHRSASSSTTASKPRSSGFFSSLYHSDLLFPKF